MGASFAAVAAEISPARSARYRVVDDMPALTASCSRVSPACCRAVRTAFTFKLGFTLIQKAWTICGECKAHREKIPGSALAPRHGVTHGAESVRSAKPWSGWASLICSALWQQLIRLATEYADELLDCLARDHPANLCAIDGSR